MILDKLKAYGWMAAAIALSVLLATQTLRLHTSQLAHAAVKTQLSDTNSAYAEERTKAATSLVAAHDAARTAEAGLGAAASEIRKETNDQVSALVTQRDSLRKRVRLAEARAAAAAIMPQAAAVAPARQAPSGVPRAELLAPIGEEDVVEADRADTIRLHLAACYRQYDKAREALNQPTERKSP